MITVLLINQANAIETVCGPSRLETTITEMRETIACAELPVGEKKVVNMGRWSSPTGVESRYVLERTSQTDYNIWINPNFVNEMTPVSTKRIVRQNVEDCLPQINANLFGPDGEKMHIRLAPENTEDPNFKEVEVRITATHREIREHSRRYSTQSTCETILHEISHLLGLADEYTDDLVDGLVSSVLFNSCRSLGAPNSVMHSNQSVEFGRSRTVTGCACSPQINTTCHDMDERAIVSARESKSCPEGYLYLETFFVPGQYGPNVGLTIKALSSGLPPPMMSEPPRVVILEQKENPRGEGLLYPAQTRSILYPNCLTKNERYYNCSRHAYERPLWFQSCSDIPDYCADPQEWLR